MKKLICFVILSVMILSLCCSCKKSGDLEKTPSASTNSFTDSCEREVKIPEKIEKIAPTGTTSQMILFPLCSDLFCGISSTPSESEKKFFTEEFCSLPVFGQFYGSKANLNMEALLSESPDLIIDTGDQKSTHKEDMNMIQEQTGIPTVFVKATLSDYKEAYRTLGKILNKTEKAEKIASYIEEKLKFAENLKSKIKDDEKVKVMLSVGADGLSVNAKGSVQAEILELLGVENAVITDKISNKNGGTVLDMEQVYNINPDVIIFDDAGAYDMVKNDDRWKKLSSIQNGRYYEVPSIPYSFLSNPPSVNRIIGIMWLSKLLYPQYCDFEIEEEMREYYSLFWGYELTDSEAKEMLSKSIYK